MTVMKGSGGIGGTAGMAGTTNGGGGATGAGGANGCASAVRLPPSRSDPASITVIILVMSLSWV
jgi:hypothetical protein